MSIVPIVVDQIAVPGGAGSVLRAFIVGRITDIQSAIELNLVTW